MIFLPLPAFSVKKTWLAWEMKMNNNNCNTLSFNQNWVFVMSMLVFWLRERLFLGSKRMKVCSLRTGWKVPEWMQSIGFSKLVQWSIFLLVLFAWTSLINQSAIGNKQVLIFLFLSCFRPEQHLVFAFKQLICLSHTSIESFLSDPLM